MIDSQPPDTNQCAFLCRSCRSIAKKSEKISANKETALCGNLVQTLKLIRRLTAYNSPIGEAARTLSTRVGWTNLSILRDLLTAGGVGHRSEFRSLGLRHPVADTEADCVGDSGPAQLIRRRFVMAVRFPIPAARRVIEQARVQLLLAFRFQLSPLPLSVFDLRSID